MNKRVVSGDRVEPRVMEHYPPPTAYNPYTYIMVVWDENVDGGLRRPSQWALSVIFRPLLATNHPISLVNVSFHGWKYHQATWNGLDWWALVCWHVRLRGGHAGFHVASLLMWLPFYEKTSKECNIWIETWIKEKSIYLEISQRDEDNGNIIIQLCGAGKKMLFINPIFITNLGDQVKRH